MKPSAKPTLQQRRPPSWKIRCRTAALMYMRNPLSSTLFRKPFLHRLQNLDQFIFLNHIGNHRIQIVQERTTEYASFISKLLVFLDCIGIIYFNTYASAHNTNFFNTRIRKPFHFTAGFLQSCGFSPCSPAIQIFLWTSGLHCKPAHCP